MPNGVDDLPHFELHYHINGQLQARCCNPYTYFATIDLRLAVDRGRILIGKTLPFRLDTESFISAIPEHWLNAPRLRRFLTTLTYPVAFTTTAGTGPARVARGVTVKFPHDRRDLLLDFLVMPSLNARQYGLVSLRDVINHFAMETVGSLRHRPGGEPVRLPDLVLHPRGR